MRRSRPVNETDRAYTQHQTAVAFLSEHVARIREDVHERLVVKIADRVTRYDEIVKELRANRPRLAQFDVLDEGAAESAAQVNTAAGNNNDDENINNLAANPSNTNSDDIGLAARRLSTAARDTAATSAAEHTANLARFLKATTTKSSSATTTTNSGSSTANDSGNNNKGTSATKTKIHPVVAAATAVRLQQDGSASSPKAKAVSTATQLPSPMLRFTDTVSAPPGVVPYSERLKTNNNVNDADAGDTTTAAATAKPRRRPDIVVIRTKFVNWTLPDALKPVLPRILEYSARLRREALEMAAVFQELGAYILLSAKPMHGESTRHHHHHYHHSDEREDPSEWQLAQIVLQNCNLMAGMMLKLSRHGSDVMGNLIKSERRNPVPQHLLRTTDEGVAQMLLASYDYLHRGFTTMRRLCCLMHNLVAKNWTKLRKLGEMSQKFDNEKNDEAVAALKRRKK